MSKTDWLVAYWGPIALVSSASLSIYEYNIYDSIILEYIAYALMGTAFLWLFTIFYFMWTFKPTHKCPICKHDLKYKIEECSYCHTKFRWK